MTRVVLFGDGPWASDTLSALVTTGWDAPIVVGRSRPSDGCLLEVAQRLPATLYLQPARPSDPEFLKAIAQATPDVILSVAYDRVVPASLLALPKFGAVNVHAGLLPRYRGCNVVNWAIINGESHIGLTIHYMDEHVDSGPILTQTQLPIGRNEGYGDVLARVVNAVPAAVLHALALVLNDSPGRSQDELDATYFPRRRDGDELIDWCMGSAQIHNFVRGITRPGPGALGRTDSGRDVRLWRTSHDARLPSYRSLPGVVLPEGPTNAVRVTTGDGVLDLLEFEVLGADGGTLSPGTRFVEV